jgi:hypothetical protein
MVVINFAVTLFIRLARWPPYSFLRHYPDFLKSKSIRFPVGVEIRRPVKPASPGAFATHVLHQGR